MENIYKTAPNMSKNFTFVTRSQILEGIDPEESMLLQPGAHKLVAKNLEVPELAAEVERAIRQVNESLEREVEQERHQERHQGRHQETQPMDVQEEEKEQTRK
jgi:hypothetical protein